MNLSLASEAELTVSKSTNDFSSVSEPYSGDLEKTSRILVSAYGFNSYLTGIYGFGFSFGNALSIAD